MNTSLADIAKKQTSKNKITSNEINEAGNGEEIGDGGSDYPDRRPKQTRYIPIPKWGEHHEWPSIGGLRHLVFFKDTNGFATAFKKVGRIILIDETEFFACIERKNQGGK